MNLPVSWRYAYRNLSRNMRRTLLSGLGVAVGCTIAIINIGFVKGKDELFIRSVAEGGAGHLRVAPRGWLLSHDQKLRLHDSQKELKSIQALPQVKVAAPRVRAQALLAMGTRLAGAELEGVDPSVEPLAFRFVRQVSKGRYLLPSDKNALVIGQTFADRLRVDVDDEIVVTLVDEAGSMKSEMFHIVGIVSTGSRQFDAMICQTGLSDIESLTGKADLGEITLLLKNPSDMDKVQAEIASRLPSEDLVHTWVEMNPQAAVAVRVNDGASILITAILLLVAFFGVASAQLTAVLERRREFGMLSAIGMPGSGMLKLVLVESVVLGGIATIVTALISFPILYWAATSGIRIGNLQPLNMGGMMIDPFIRADVGGWVFGYSILLSLFTTTLASLYPAWFATRLDPAKALRVAQ